MLLGMSLDYFVFRDFLWDFLLVRSICALGLGVTVLLLRRFQSVAQVRVIVQAIVSLAHSLGIRVVAEGVETEGQRAFLCDIGCELIQGYLVSRPQPAVDAARFMCGAREPAGTAA
jgi:predicted signal transduction protein with EAL and GGDEF domain